jgi:hypothetical protein
VSGLRRQAARALGDAIAQRVRLQEKPTVISTPPSSVAEYPRVAVWLESFSRKWAQEDELMVGSDGEPLTGARAGETPVGPVVIQHGVRLSCVGTLIGSGRIWVGCRHPGKREDVEDEIDLLFTLDDGAPSRLMVEMSRPRVGQYELAHAWNAAVFVGDSEWTREFVFAERLWAWIKFDLEVPILVPRTSPLVQRFIVGIDLDFRQPMGADGNVTDLDGGADTETVTISV